MRYLLSLPLACTLASCALPFTPTTPQWDRHFGDVARATLAQQVIDADAGRNRDPVAGMDGRAAHAVFERYQKASSDPAPQPSAFTIGVSGAK
ncbi:MULTISPECIES: hypothetical protein [unclassified Duganella]|uniref:hypothetical protein n=1 Tax=unclassified Duganella TaxID=2636909 RepID=UPI000E350457|nr:MULTISPECIES: hypothetical protein [unclassified Duganella]RFP12621.1 hypothetical protein D0T23_16080 [Duganella sp. BJB475]RFP28597.1 hypothetical protein D0T21_19890 [Duganella sp. BJB476]